jgi:hypothetical protein
MATTGTHVGRRPPEAKPGRAGEFNITFDDDPAAPIPTEEKPAAAPQLDRETAVKVAERVERVLETANRLGIDMVERPLRCVWLLRLQPPAPTTTMDFFTGETVTATATDPWLYAGVPDVLPRDGVNADHAWCLWPSKDAVDAPTRTMLEAAVNRLAGARATTAAGDEWQVPEFWWRRGDPLPAALPVVPVHVDVTGLPRDHAAEVLLVPLERVVDSDRLEDLRVERLDRVRGADTSVFYARLDYAAARWAGDGVTALDPEHAYHEDGAVRPEGPGLFDDLPLDQPEVLEWAAATAFSVVRHAVVLARARAERARPNVLLEPWVPDELFKEGGAEPVDIVAAFMVAVREFTGVDLDRIWSPRGVVTAGAFHAVFQLVLPDRTQYDPDGNPAKELQRALGFTASATHWLARSPAASQSASTPRETAEDTATAHVSGRGGTTFNDDWTPNSNDTPPIQYDKVVELLFNQCIEFLCITHGERLCELDRQLLFDRVLEDKDLHGIVFETSHRDGDLNVEFASDGDMARALEVVLHEHVMSTLNGVPLDIRKRIQKLYNSVSQAAAGHRGVAADTARGQQGQMLAVILKHMRAMSADNADEREQIRRVLAKVAGASRDDRGPVKRFVVKACGNVGRGLRAIMAWRKTVLWLARAVVQFLPMTGAPWVIAFIELGNLLALLLEWVQRDPTAPVATGDWVDGLWNALGAATSIFITHQLRQPHDNAIRAQLLQIPVGLDWCFGTDWFTWMWYLPGRAIQSIGATAALWLGGVPTAVQALVPFRNCALTTVNGDAAVRCLSGTAADDTGRVLYARPNSFGTDSPQAWLGNRVLTGLGVAEAHRQWLGSTSVVGKMKEIVATATSVCDAGVFLLMDQYDATMERGAVPPEYVYAARSLRNANVLHTAQHMEYLRTGGPVDALLVSDLHPQLMSVSDNQPVSELVMKAIGDKTAALWETTKDVAAAAVDMLPWRDPPLTRPIDQTRPTCAPQTLDFVAVSAANNGFNMRWRPRLEVIPDMQCLMQRPEARNGIYLSRAAELAVNQTQTWLDGQGPGARQMFDELVAETALEAARTNRRYFVPLVDVREPGSNCYWQAGVSVHPVRRRDFDAQTANEFYHQHRLYKDPVYGNAQVMVASGDDAGAMYMQQQAINGQAREPKFKVEDMLLDYRRDAQQTTEQLFRDKKDKVHEYLFSELTTETNVVTGAPPREYWAATRSADGQRWVMHGDHVGRRIDMVHRPPPGVTVHGYGARVLAVDPPVVGEHAHDVWRFRVVNDIAERLARNTDGIDPLRDAPELRELALHVHEFLQGETRTIDDLRTAFTVVGAATGTTVLNGALDTIIGEIDPAGNDAVQIGPVEVTRNQVQDFLEGKFNTLGGETVKWLETAKSTWPASIMQAAVHAQAELAFTWLLKQQARQRIQLFTGDMQQAVQLATVSYNARAARVMKTLLDTVSQTTRYLLYGFQSVGVDRRLDWTEVTRHRYALVERSLRNVHRVGMRMNQSIGRPVIGAMARWIDGESPLAVVDSIVRMDIGDLIMRDHIVSMVTAAELWNLKALALAVPISAGLISLAITLAGGFAVGTGVTAVAMSVASALETDHSIRLADGRIMKNPDRTSYISLLVKGVKFLTTTSAVGTTVTNVVIGGANLLGAGVPAVATDAAVLYWANTAVYATIGYFTLNYLSGMAVQMARRWYMHPRRLFSPLRITRFQHLIEEMARHQDNLLYLGGVKPAENYAAGTIRVPHWRETSCWFTVQDTVDIFAQYALQLLHVCRLEQVERSREPDRKNDQSLWWENVIKEWGVALRDKRPGFRDGRTSLKVIARIVTRTLALAALTTQPTVAVDWRVTQRWSTLWRHVYFTVDALPVTGGLPVDLLTIDDLRALLLTHATRSEVVGRTEHTVLKPSVLGLTEGYPHRCGVGMFPLAPDKDQSLDDYLGGPGVDDALAAYSTLLSSDEVPFENVREVPRPEFTTPEQAAVVFRETALLAATAFAGETMARGYRVAVAGQLRARLANGMPRRAALLSALQEKRVPNAAATARLIDAAVLEAVPLEHVAQALINRGYHRPADVTAHRAVATALRELGQHVNPVQVGAWTRWLATVAHDEPPDAGVSQDEADLADDYKEPAVNSELRKAFYDKQSKRVDDLSMLIDLLSMASDPHQSRHAWLRPVVLRAVTTPRGSDSYYFPTLQLRVQSGNGFQTIQIV